MPNWVTHVIEFKGSTEELQRLLREACEPRDEQDGGPILSFNKIVPMPESIRNTECDSYSELAEQLYNDAERKYGPDWVAACLSSWHKDLGTEEELKALSLPELRTLVSQRQPQYEETAKQLKSNRELYGHADWYEWSWDKWGTKWDASDTAMQQMPCSLEEARPDDEMAMKFDTAWGHPEPVMTALAELFPRLSFMASFFDEGWNFCGVGMGTDGKYTVRLASPCSSDNPDALAVYEAAYGYPWKSDSSDDDEDEDETDDQDGEES